jgi:outer membrane protein OmpA-like peptidoglycan-associated protein/lipid-binding SYLF domain-containing protein
MKARIRVTVLFSVLLLPAAGFAGTDDVLKERQRLDRIAEETLQQFFEERPGAKGLYDQAYGYAVFQSIKIVIGVSGGGGRGVAVNKQDASRTYMKMGTGGIGLGLGGQKYRILMLFRDAKAYSDFILNGWEGNAGASAAAGTEGRNAKTSFEQAVEVFQFTRKGLLAKADISGTRFWLYDKLNLDLNLTDADTDGDGVPDRLDQCPRTPKGATVDTRGCWVLNNMLFDTAKYEIEPAFESTLDQVANVLRNNPDLRVRIDGHTDAAGTELFNLGLSQKRAEAVKAALVQRGIPPERLEARGFGESVPVVRADAEQRARQNRRVEMTVLSS